MLIQKIIFFVFSFLAVASALMVIVSNNPVRAALSLVLTFFASAGIWLLAEAEFLALVLVLVYVGAVMTLFLFVVMMMNIDVAEQKRRFIKHVPIVAVIVGLLIVLMFMAVKPEYFGFTQSVDLKPHAANFSDVKALGRILYTDYVYPFEVAGVLLLVAIIAAISLVHRGPRDSKVQSIDKQIRVRREDRVRLVNVNAETGE